MSFFILLICQFFQKLMGSRSPLLKIDGFLGTHADKAPVSWKKVIKEKSFFAKHSISASHDPGMGILEALNCEMCASSSFEFEYHGATGIFLKKSNTNCVSPGAMLEI